MRSSYIENNYGQIFTNMVKACQFRVVVELGVLDGYSTLSIGRGLKWIKETLGPTFTLDSYDLWEDYNYKHGNMQDVQAKIDSEGLMEFVKLYKEDAFEVYKRYPNRSIYLLHVDLSNTGDTVKKIMDQWNDKMVHDGIILFEGGSEERDNIEWMKKYNCPSIRKEINTNPIIDKFYIVATYNKFPSLTYLYKKYDEEHMP